MRQLSEIPTQEMLDDRRDALQDVQDCRTALDVGVTRYSGGGVADRLRANLKQIEVIDAELARRGEAHADHV